MKMKWGLVLLFLRSLTAAFSDKAAQKVEENVVASRRPTNVTGLVVICGIGSSSVNDISFLDPEESLDSENRWIALSEFPMSINSHAAAATDPSTVYVAGGWDDFSRLPYLHRYDARDDSWTMMRSMPEPRASFGLTFINGFLYATGGVTTSWETTSVLKYDTSADTWSEVNSLKRSCYDCPAVSVGENIYVIGGSSFQSPSTLDLVQSYNTLTDEWTLMSPIPKPRSYAAACAVDGIIYLIGGIYPPDYPEKRVTERFDPATDTWREVAPMLSGKALHACASYGQYIYVFGGQGDDGSTEDSVAKYDTVSDEWTEAGTMPNALMDSAVVSLHLP